MRTLRRSTTWRPIFRTQDRHGPSGWPWVEETRRSLCTRETCTGRCRAGRRNIFPPRSKSTCARAFRTRSCSAVTIPACLRAHPHGVAGARLPGRRDGKDLPRQRRAHSRIVGTTHAHYKTRSACDGSGERHRRAAVLASHAPATTSRSTTAAARRKPRRSRRTQAAAGAHPALPLRRCRRGWRAGDAEDCRGPIQPPGRAHQ